jgi:acetyltransferase (GNAT) family protein
VSVADRVRDKLDRLRSELARDDLDRTGRALHVAGLSLTAVRLWPALAVAHERFYELNTPPKQFRGLRDLRIRLAVPDDAAALSALDGTDAGHFIDRLARGDLGYVGEHEGRLLAHSWFHRGPASFDDDAPLLPRWHVPADSYWSYNAFTLPEARTSGVFVKLFQTALRELLVDRGAARVRCRVKVANAPSVALHERFGFTPLGTLIAIAVPRARLLWWQSTSGDRSQDRRWIERRDRTSVMTFPPGAGA